MSWGHENQAVGLGWYGGAPSVLENTQELSMRWAALIFGVMSVLYSIMAGDALLPIWHRHDIFVGSCCSMLIPSLLAIIFGVAAAWKRPSWVSAIPAYIGVSLAITTVIRFVFWIRAWG